MNAWAAVVGGVTVVIAAHAELIVKDTEPDSPGTAAPFGDVAVIVME